MNNGKICVSICAETADALIKNLYQAENYADVIELRLDCLRKEELEKIWRGIELFRAKFNGKILATFRPREQGGKRELTFSERENFWMRADNFDFVDWADIELDFPEEKIKRLPGKTFETIIKSFHDFEKVPLNVEEIYRKMAASSPLVKIALQASDVIDTIEIWKLLATAKKESAPVIPIAMGEAGKWTRILGLAHGAFMTYAALETGSETAAGQISARDLIETYRVKELDENTEIYGILGNPVSHSLSPYIHNEAFQLMNRNAVFIPFEVKNLDEFAAKFLRAETREVELNFRGFSVTIPHKQAIIKHLDSIDETAEKIGAVNTVRVVDGRLHGFNTDAAGFIEPLKNVYGNLKDARVAVLGSGGAARAVVYALKKESAKVTVYARDPEKAQKLASDFQVETAKLDSKNLKFDVIDVLVNATPLGTRGALENDTPVYAEQIPYIHLAYDLVYNPLETRFLREANAAGIPTLSGLAMLISQAAAQFNIWTNLDAPIKQMEQIAAIKLRSR